MNEDKINTDEMDDILNFTDDMTCDFISVIEQHTEQKDQLTPMHVLGMFEAAGQALAEPYDLMPPEIRKIALQVLLANMTGIIPDEDKTSQ